MTARGKTKRFSYIVTGVKVIVILFLSITTIGLALTAYNNSQLALEEARLQGYSQGCSEGYTNGYQEAIHDIPKQVEIIGFEQDKIYIRFPNDMVHEYEYDFTSAVEQIFGYTEEDINIISGTIYGEANTARTNNEKAAVGETIVNRYGLGQGTIEEICTRFYSGYKSEKYDGTKYYEMAKDVLNRFFAKEIGCKVARVLPDDYIYFVGDGKKTNYFTNTWPVRFVNAWNFEESESIY